MDCEQDIIDDEVDRVDDRITRLNEQLAYKEEIYRKQLVAMQETLYEIQEQQSSISIATRRRPPWCWVAGRV